VYGIFCIFLATGSIIARWDMDMHPERTKKEVKKILNK